MLMPSNGGRCKISFFYLSFKTKTHRAWNLSSKCLGELSQNLVCPSCQCDYETVWGLQISTQIKISLQNRIKSDTTPQIFFPLHFIVKSFLK